uniref:Glutamate decarboxylase like 1 n=1 Tax=Astatotilapia calliptera TaxID=8154 RepID=A0AAX7VNJ7_ASTCA
MEGHHKEEKTSDVQSPADPGHPVKCSPVIIDNIPLNGPTVNVLASENFIHQSMSIIVENAIKKATDVREKVCEWRSPEQLKELLDLELRDGGESESEILQRFKDAIRYSVKTSECLKFNELRSEHRDTTLGKWLPECFCSSDVEGHLMNPENKHLLRFSLPGGSMSNMYAVNLARYRCCPDIKENGLSAAPRLVMFTSQECHYSISKAAALLGIGTKNVYAIPSDERGKMIPSALEEQILSAKSEGAVPFMVNATAGTTVLGAFDPIDVIADICEKHNLWLHVDACWGGAALVSSKHKHLLKGIHRADSVAWNPHKMLMACLQCSAFMVRDKTSLLQRCHSARASYLFQQDKFYDVSYDTGDKSVQCSRKPDAFKIWLMWKALGSKELEQRVDRALAMARYLAEEIKKREGFRLLMEPEYANICFWYIPPSLQTLPDGPELWEKLHKVAPVIKERMMKKGSMMVGYQPHGEKANFFRMIIISPQVSRQDMDFVLDEINNLGKDL